LSASTLYHNQHIHIKYLSLSLYQFYIIIRRSLVFSLFLFNYSVPAAIYTLSLHDALPIYICSSSRTSPRLASTYFAPEQRIYTTDRKSTRLNSSHVSISYAVFCLKKKKKIKLQLIETVVPNSELKSMQSKLRSIRNHETNT